MPTDTFADTMPADTLVLDGVAKTAPVVVPFDVDVPANQECAIERDSPCVSETMGFGSLAVVPYVAPLTPPPTIVCSSGVSDTTAPMQCDSDSDSDAWIDQHEPVPLDVLAMFLHTGLAVYSNE